MYKRQGSYFLTTSKEYIFIASPYESYGSEMHQFLIDKYNVKIHPQMYEGRPTIVYELSRIMKPELKKKRILLEQLKTVLSVFNREWKLKDENGQTPLHYAVECGDLEFVEFLLLNDYSCDDEDNNGDTPLKLAFDYYHYDIFEKLLDSWFDVKSMQQKILEIACKKPGCSKFVELLLEHIIEIPDDILHQAIEGHQIETVEILIENPLVRLDFVDEKEMTVLHKALEENQIEIFKMLLEDPRTDPNDSSLLNRLLVDNKIEILQMLLEDPRTDPNDSSLLILAVEYDRIEAVDLLLNHPDIDPNIVYDIYDGDEFSYSETAFSTAILHRNLHIIKKFIQNPKVDTNKQDLMGNTELHNLIQNCGLNRKTSIYIRLIAFLLLHDSKIDVNVKNNDGKTPLDLAEEIPEIKYLLTDFFDRKKQIMVNYVGTMQPDIISQNPEKQLKRDQLRLGPELINEVTSFLQWEDLPIKIQNTLLTSEIRKKMNV